MGNAHLFTLNVPQAAIGLEPGMLAEMFEQIFELTPFQIQLLRSAVGAVAGGCDGADHAGQPGRASIGTLPR